MDKPKTHRFPVDVRSLDGKLTLASVPGKAVPRRRLVRHAVHVHANVSAALAA